MHETNQDDSGRLAQKRAGFKRSVYSYLVISLFLWLVWWFTSGKDTGFTGIPWPVWVMLGGGLSLAWQYFKAYQAKKNI